MAEINLVPASMYALEGSVREVDTAAEILADRPDLARLVITHRFPLEGFHEGLCLLEDSKDCGKVMITMGTE